MPSSALPFQDHPSRRNPLSCLLRASIRCSSDSSVCSVCLALTQPGVSEAPHRRAQPCLSSICTPDRRVCPSHGPPTHDGHGEGLHLKAIRNKAAKDAHISCERAPESWCLSSYQRLTWRPLCCVDLLTRQPHSRASVLQPSVPAVLVFILGSACGSLQLVVC